MKIDRKTGLFIAIGVFFSLLIISLTINYQTARKKGKDTLFDFSPPTRVQKN